MSDFALNFNTANLYGSTALGSMPPLNLNSSLYGGSFGGSINSVFSYPQSQSNLGYGNFNSSTKNYSMYKGSVATPNASLFSSSGSGFVITPFDYNQVNQAIQPIQRTLSNPFGRATSTKKTNYKIESLSPNTSLTALSGIYNPNKGLSLAKSVLSNVHNRSTGYCARYVKTAVSQSGLGAYESGHAYQLVDSFENNKNFKEISINPKDLTKLPAGCIIVYDKGAAGYSKNYGHIEVTLGNGKAASDFITNNIRQSNNINVFVPA